MLSDDDALPLNSLLAAISRFSLQTSARNQWFGTITARDHDDVQQHVDVLLADGKTRLKVAITAQSGARLGLDEGKEVLILLKSAVGRHYSGRSGRTKRRQPITGYY
ncbi:transcriptional regulator [Escherichia coli]|uniref:Transcriptional regulator n=1 Tax=Escherichia coli TaxID=562 RepID=A0A376ZQB1_ECOLX|nr:transcriptional regulator [Escherichia coli]